MVVGNLERDEGNGIAVWRGIKRNRSGASVYFASSRMALAMQLSRFVDHSKESNNLWTYTIYLNY